MCKGEQQHFIKKIINAMLLKFSSVGLASKLILFYVLLIAVPVTVFGFYTFHNVRASMILDLEKSGQQEIQRILNSINRNSEICETAAQIVLSNKKFLEYASDFDNTSADELLELSKGLLIDIGRIRNVNPDIYRLCIYAKGAKLLEAFPTIYSEERIKGSDILDEIFKQNGRNYWKLMHEDSLETSKKMFTSEITSLYREAKNDREQHIGIIEVSMLTRDFFSEMYTYEDSEESFVCVINENKNLFLNESAACVRKMNFNKNLLQDLLDRNTQGESGYCTTEINKKPVIVVYGFSKKINSYIYLVTNIDVLAKKLNTAGNNVLFGIIAVFVLLSAITYFVTSALLKKVKIMKDSIRKVQQGDLSVSIPYLGNDEIGELAGNFRKMMNRVNELIALTIQNQEAIKESDLKALSAQINSHFTYNTLDTIQMMAEVEEKYEIADAVNYLGKMMRYGINWRNQFSTIKDEIDYVSNYISLINIKYNEIADLSVNIGEEFFSVKLPRMVLQPVVENCIFHGIRPKGIKGLIFINALSKNSQLIIEVIDNGKGIEKEKLIVLQMKLQECGESMSACNDSDGIGLGNINERIKLYYGNEYGLDIESQINTYTRIRILLPYSNLKTEGAGR